MGRTQASSSKLLQPTARRWLACLLLAAFTLAQGAALAHTADAHDHDGACTACRLIDDQTHALATSVGPSHLSGLLETPVTAVPESILDHAVLGLHPARAPPIA